MKSPKFWSVGMSITLAGLFFLCLYSFAWELGYQPPEFTQNAPFFSYLFNQFTCLFLLLAALLFHTFSFIAYHRITRMDLLCFWGITLFTLTTVTLRFVSFQMQVNQMTSLSYVRNISLKELKQVVTQDSSEIIFIECPSCHRICDEVIHYANENHVELLLYTAEQSGRLGASKDEKQLFDSLHIDSFPMLLVLEDGNVVEELDYEELVTLLEEPSDGLILAE